MKKIIEWHKNYAEKMLEKLGLNSYQGMWLSWFKGVIMGIILMVLLSGCYVVSEGTYYSDPNYKPYYTNAQHDIYYWGDNIYYGYYSGFYYYYGVPHYHPWWHYYIHQPAFNHHTHSHIYVHCDKGNYVYGHRGNRFNNEKGGDYKPNKVRVKTNKINVNTNPIHNGNKTNVKINTNTRVKITPNTNTKVKTNINYTRPNKTNTNKTNINKSNRNNSTKPTYNKKNNSNKSRTNSKKPR